MTAQNDLEERLKRLENSVDWLVRIVSSLFGASSPWLSPHKAAGLLGLSEENIKKEIARAEEARLNGLPYPLIYGKHYRNDKDQGSKTPTWKVHVGNYEKFLSIPPDQRGVAA